MSLQAFNQDSWDLLLNSLIYFIKHVDNHPRIEVGKSIDVAQLIDDRIQEA